jgi:hypothetical protein
VVLAYFHCRKIFWIGRGEKVLSLFKGFSLFIFFSLIATLIGCSPEVGSEKWCEAMKEKPKGGWTVGETVDYGKHCIIK